MQDATAEPGTHDRLENFPISFFAMVMGLMGLSLALHAGSVPWPALARASEAVLWIAVAAFAGIAVLYLTKWLRHADAVSWEWHHPVRLAFFPAIPISLLLIATRLLASHPAAGPAHQTARAAHGQRARSPVAHHSRELETAGKKPRPTRGRHAHERAAAGRRP